MRINLGRADMNDAADHSLYGPMFASPAMRELLSDTARLQRMLDVEAALARAEAAAGVIPATAVKPIEDACRASLYDMGEIGEAAALAGNVPIPLVKRLTTRVAASDPEAARYVHWGATSQDIIDTALVLELRTAMDLLIADLGRAATGFAILAEHHRHTPMPGRTWLQHALPIPFGLKLAGYAAALARARSHLARLQRENLSLQFGGAAGTLAALGHRGLDVAAELAADLGLALPDAPWHAHRDRLTEVAAAIAIMTGSCGKIARDVALLMQTEIGEALEPAAAGRGGSSTMPQKRNPTLSALALGCAAMAPNLAATLLAAEIGEHERAAGTWQAEWITFPALLRIASGALHAIAEIAEGLEVNAHRMRANLDATGGLIMAEALTMALGARLGRIEAHQLVEEACHVAIAEKVHLSVALGRDPRVAANLGPGEIDGLFDPLSYQGVAQSFIDRLLRSAGSGSG